MWRNKGGSGCEKGQGVVHKAHMHTHMGPWSELLRHVLKMEALDTLFPPPKASLKLIAALGMLKTTSPSARVSVAREVNQALLCSWYAPISCTLLYAMSVPKGCSPLLPSSCTVRPKVTTALMPVYANSQSTTLALRLYPAIITALASVR